MTVISAAQWVSVDDHGGHRMPSPFLPERLRELRIQAGLSQAELADKIGGDARQVSRYENGRVAPNFEAGVRIAETFDTSVDYLVTLDVPWRPRTPFTTSSTPASPTSASLTTSAPPSSASSTPSPPKQGSASSRRAG